MSLPPLDLAQLKHHKYYCEENAWQLLAAVRALGRPLHEWRAIVITNGAEAVPLWCHSAEDAAVVWDYHVVCAHRADGEWLVYDQDTTLGMPVTVDQYWRNAIRTNTTLLHKYHRRLSIIAAEDYWRRLTSDRSHMRADDGIEWLHTPPPWPCINQEAPDGCIALREWRTMDDAGDYKRLHNVRHVTCDSDDMISVLHSFVP